MAWYNDLGITDANKLYRLPPENSKVGWNSQDSFFQEAGQGLALQVVERDLAKLRESGRECQVQGQVRARNGGRNGHDAGKGQGESRCI